MSCGYQSVTKFKLKKKKQGYIYYKFKKQIKNIYEIGPTCKTYIEKYKNL